MKIMKINIIAVAIILVLLTVGCSKETVNNGNNIKSNDNATIAVQPASDTVAYTNIISKDLPDNYPVDKFPLSQDANDKIMKINTIEDTAFDFKIVTIRSYHEIIDEYAALWELDDEKVIYNDDLGVGNLMGTLSGYEIFVNASEESPEIPEGARTYLGILVQKRK